MLNTFLFDLDGTLTDSQEGITNCLLYALQELDCAPIPSREELSGLIGMKLKDCFHTLLDTDDDAYASQGMALYRKRFAVEGKFENKVYSGIPEALEQLQARGAKLYVATSKSIGFAREILDHFGLSVYFNGVYGSSLDGRLESKPELIAHIIEQEKLTAATTVMIGDRLFDILGGKSNNTATAGVAWGYGSIKELQEAGADRILYSPGELVQI